MQLKTILNRVERFKSFVYGEPRWARRLSWKEVATVFHTTRDHVRDSVRHAVAGGIVHRDLAGAQAIGVDEIQWRRGHHYLTLVYQIDAGCKRLPWIGRERTEPSLRRGLELLGETFCSACSSCAAISGSPYEFCRGGKKS